MHWVFLAIANTGEVIATSALKASQGFTRIGPSAISAAGYMVSFYFLALVLRTIPVGVAYAIWAGAGVAAITVIGWVVFGQKLDTAAMVGIGLIVAGVVVLNTLSNSTGH
jgi:small multidrug resistance pump